jgi:WD40 repeat protein
MTYLFEKDKRYARRALAVSCALLASAILAYGQRRNAGRAAPGFDDVVFAVSFSPDGRTLAIARGASEQSQRFGRVELWDTETGALRHVIKGFDGPVISISFSPDGQTLVSASSEFHTEKIQEKAHSRDGSVFGELKWWDAATGELKRKLTLPGEGNSSLRATYSPDGQKLAIVESFLQYSYVTGGAPVDVTSVPFGAFPNTLFGRSAYITGDLKVLDAQTAEVRFKVNSHQSRQPSFSVDGKLLALINGKEVKLWDTQTGKEVQKLKGFKGTPNVITFSPDGKLLAVLSLEFDRKVSRRAITWTARGEIKLFDVATWKDSFKLGNAGAVSSIAFNPSGRVLLIGGMVRAAGGLVVPGVKLYDLQTGLSVNLPTSDEDFTGAVDSLSLSQDGRLLAFKAGSGTVQLVDTQSWKVIQTWDASSSGSAVERPVNRFLLSVRRVLAIAFSPDARTLLGENDQGEIKLWDPQTGEVKKKLANDSGDDPQLVAVSTDGKSFAEITGGKLLFWSVGDNAKQKVELPAGAAISTIALSSGGGGASERKVLAIGRGQEVLLLTPAGRISKTLSGRQGSVNRLAFSDDGLKLASADEDGSIEIWNVTKAQVEKTIAARTSISSLCFTPDGKSLATAGADHAVVIWDLETGSPRARLQKHNAPVNALAFSPDGQWLASGSDDRTVVIWEIASGKSKRTLKGHDQTVTSLAFSPDGRLLASGSGNAAVVIWDVKSGKLNRVMR